jgi:hypothetical protein
VAGDGDGIGGIVITGRYFVNENRYQYRLRNGLDVPQKKHCHGS